MLPIVCPCCRASNETGPTCRRCKADLSPLFAVAERRAFLLAKAREDVAAGRAEDALASLNEARQIRDGDDVRRLDAVARLTAGDFAGAWAAYPMRK